MTIKTLIYIMILYIHIYVSYGRTFQSSFRREHFHKPNIFMLKAQLCLKNIKAFI